MCVGLHISMSKSAVIGRLEACSVCVRSQSPGGTGHLSPNPPLFGCMVWFFRLRRCHPVLLFTKTPAIHSIHCVAAPT